MPKRKITRPVAPVSRYALNREEAAASLGMSVTHFDARVRPFIKTISCGQLVLIPPEELDRWVKANAYQIVDTS